MGEIKIGQEQELTKLVKEDDIGDCHHSSAEIWKAIFFESSINCLKGIDELGGPFVILL